MAHQDNETGLTVKRLILKNRGSNFYLKLLKTMLVVIFKPEIKKVVLHLFNHFIYKQHRKLWPIIYFIFCGLRLKRDGPGCKQLITTPNRNKETTQLKQTKRYHQGFKEVLYKSDILVKERNLEVSSETYIIINTYEIYFFSFSTW